MNNAGANKLICDFMGFHFGENGTIGTHPTIFPMQMGVDTINDVKFLTSWDWLMPVCEKCKGILDQYIAEEFHRILNEGKTDHKTKDYMLLLNERISWTTVHFSKQNLYDIVSEFLVWRQTYKA